MTDRARMGIGNHPHVSEGDNRDGTSAIDPGGAGKLPENTWSETLQNKGKTLCE